MTERFNHKLARRACIASAQARLAREQARLADRRRKHGRTVRIMLRMDALTRRLLYLETGGDPFDRRFTGMPRKGGVR